MNKQKLAKQKTRGVFIDEQCPECRCEMLGNEVGDKWCSNMRCMIGVDDMMDDVEILTRKHEFDYLLCTKLDYSSVPVGQKTLRAVKLLQALELARAIVDDPDEMRPHLGMSEIYTLAAELIFCITGEYEGPH